MTGRLKNVLLVGLVVVMVNLPFVHSTWQQHRLDRDGTDVAATLTSHEQRGERNVVGFEVRDADRPDGVGGFEGSADVDRATYDDAVATGTVRVRVLDGSVAVWRVEGQESSRLGLVITVLADLFLLVMVLLLVRFGSRLRQEMVLVATQDLERCPPGSVLDQVDGLRFVVCGEVEAIGDDEVVLDLGDRRVRVLLDGHHNPAGHQQPVRATGTMHG
ncbi:hypothetical protein [Nocardioides halotolerans]|uniref:hypothetical protein n=1 Tax=Nocardioides halotolerans TaxID=433660 RepID=UPI00041C5D02|nr:hypothetical protein [Nocardioides halotolerans]